MLPIEQELNRVASLVEDALDNALSPEISGSTVLAQAMRYSTLGR